MKYFSGEEIREGDEVLLGAPRRGVVKKVLVAGEREGGAWSAPEGGVLIDADGLGLSLTVNPERDQELVLVRRWLLRIYADFNSQDEQGRVWLNFAPSLEDMKGDESQLFDGARVIVYTPNELEVEATLVFDGIWLGVPDYTTIRYLDGAEPGEQDLISRT